MDDRNREYVADAPFFCALVTPHRSLAPKGFAIFMVFTGTVCSAAGLLFWSLGAWPVVGFLGLDVIAVWTAFRLSYRSARAYEEIFVSLTDVYVREVSASGRMTEHHFNPRWIRLSVTWLEDEGCVRVSLTGRGSELVLGGFLNPDDRDSFATAVAGALSAARAGYPLPVR